VIRLESWQLCYLSGKGKLILGFLGEQVRNHQIRLEGKTLNVEEL
jgi:hypothetical protein